MFPSRYLIKKYIGRLILGIFLVPVAVIFLMLIEMQSIQQESVFPVAQPGYTIWAGRIICLLILYLSFKNILSIIKIFMAAIPLTYKEIQGGIRVNAWLFTLIVEGITISIMHLFLHPEISLVLAIVCTGLIIGLFIRRKRKRVEAKVVQASVKPHRTKDV